MFEINLRFDALLTKAALLLALLLNVPAWAVELKDPTQPLNYIKSQSQQAPPLRLMSILMSGERKLAIINGVTMAEQQSVGGITLKRIEEGQVWVIKDGIEQRLLLRKKQVHKR